MRHVAVAIDGPTGAGKTTLARILARDLGYLYVDTGAMYRAVGLYVCRQGLDSLDAAGTVACLPSIALEIAHGEHGQRIMLNGEDISDAIRSETASRYASDVSAVPEVRAFLLETQQAFARTASVVMEGRDIATVVLPEAQVKIFLTATSQIRAYRRVAQLRESGQAAEYAVVHSALLSRDYNDSNRVAAPLRPAEDGVIVDTTHLNIEQVRKALISIVKETIHV